jgi:hypothetical protein
MTTAPPTCMTDQQDSALTGWHSWGIWAADHEFGEIFVENLDRAERRRSVLTQLAAGRFRRQYRGLR